MARKEVKPVEEGWVRIRRWRLRGIEMEAPVEEVMSAARAYGRRINDLEYDTLRDAYTYLSGLMMEHGEDFTEGVHRVVANIGNVLNEVALRGVEDDS